MHVRYFYWLLKESALEVVLKILHSLLLLGLDHGRVRRNLAVRGEAIEELSTSATSTKCCLELVVVMTWLSFLPDDAGSWKVEFRPKLLKPEQILEDRDLLKGRCPNCVGDIKLTGVFLGCWSSSIILSSGSTAIVCVLMLMDVMYWKYGYQCGPSS